MLTDEQAGCGGGQDLAGNTRLLINTDFLCWMPARRSKSGMCKGGKIGQFGLPRSPTAGTAARMCCIFGFWTSNAGRWPDLHKITEAKKRTGVRVRNDADDKSRLKAISVDS